jgi:hypothetical protein
MAHFPWFPDSAPSFHPNHRKSEAGDRVKSSKLPGGGPGEGRRSDLGNGPLIKIIMTIKRQYFVAVVLLLAIPVVLMFGGALCSFINPENAARTSNYARNWHLLNTLKMMVMWGTAAVAFVLWLLVCFQIIRAKNRSAAWLVLAALGPFGLAVLAMLSNRVSTETDRYSRFVGNMTWFVRAAYELCTFVIFWELAYQVMLLKSNITIRIEAARTGVSVAQVTDIHNASGGMWAFSEGLEVMFFVALLYLLRPVVFNLVRRILPSGVAVSSEP